MDKQDKKPVGRPSQLDETLELAKSYLYGGYESVGEVIPSIAGLAGYAKKARKMIYDYAKASPEFSDIVEAILSLQESKLINNGLMGNYNSSITKLILTKHGYSDKVETVVNADEEITAVTVNVKSAKKSND